MSFSFFLVLPFLCVGVFKAFDVVEKSYFETIDDALAEKANLQAQLPEVRTHSHGKGNSYSSVFQGPTHKMNS